MGAYVHAKLEHAAKAGEAREVSAHPPPEVPLDIVETHRGRPLRVLVVDDQKDVREVLVANLEAFGYRVLEASSGEAGLAIIDGDPAIDLLIADYAMAGMNGVELVRWARTKRPGLPAVMMTGFVDISRIESQIDEVELMKKPYRRARLAAVIERALQRGGDRGSAGKVAAPRSPRAAHR
jgi:CheY-like chemotaxis protein